MIHQIPDTLTASSPNHQQRRRAHQLYGLVHIGRRATRQDIGRLRCPPPRSGFPLRHLPDHADQQSSARVEHEATVERFRRNSSYHVQNRGHQRKSDAEGLLVNGFLDPVIKILSILHRTHPSHATQKWKAAFDEKNTNNPRTKNTPFQVYHTGTLGYGIFSSQRVRKHQHQKNVSQCPSTIKRMVPYHRQNTKPI